MPVESGHTVVITAADYYLGYHTALRMLESYEGHFTKCILTATHPERLKHLKDMGAQIIHVDPDNQESYEEAFKQANWIMFFPEPEAGRVQAANRAIDAMKKVNAKNVIMMSIDSCEYQHLRYVAEFKEIEDKLKQTIPDHVIVRCTFLQNMFHFQGPYVAKHHRFPMTLPEEAEFAPLHLDDAIEACTIICKDGMEKHRSETYVFTGPDKVTGPKVASALQDSIDSSKNIEYEELSRDEMKKYLCSLKDRMGEQLQSRDKHHELLRYEFMGQPTEVQVETLIEEMEYIKKGKMKRTDDLKKLTGRQGHPPEHFFSHHKEEFAPRRE